MLRTCIISALIMLSAFVRADASESDDLFQKGLAAYQNRKYEEARDDFQKILTQGPTSARLLHNLALTYYQMNQKPRALAFWRKALAVDPGFRAARAGRELLEGRMGMRPFERDSFNLWIRRNMELISPFELLWVLALLLTVGGGLWIRYYADRRHALNEASPLPPFPAAALVVLIFFFVCGGLMGLKVAYEFTPRATVVDEKAAARSLPSEEGVNLFDLPGGTEVLIKREQNGWKQIQNPEGSTGWVKDSDVMVSSEG